MSKIKLKLLIIYLLVFTLASAISEPLYEMYEGKIKTKPVGITPTQLFLPIGSKQGVKTAMEFEVIRNEKVIATGLITEVKDYQATLKITLIEAGTKINWSDIVLEKKENSLNESDGQSNIVETNKISENNTQETLPTVYPDDTQKILRKIKLLKLKLSSYYGAYYYRYLSGIN